MRRHFRFEDGNVVKQVETLLPYKYLDLKKPEIEVQVQEKEDAYILQVTSDVFAPFVELDFEDADAIFSDNYFHLTGEMREVVLRKKDVRNGNFTDAMELQERLRVRSLIQVRKYNDCVFSYLHLRFEEIHPFADGNGHVGRTLLNYYLMTHDYPPLILYSEDKRTYYMALAVYDKTRKISGFIEFLKEQMVKTWEKKKRMPVKLNMFL